ncbi:MAG: 2,3-bisphosphoglycerate-independent phosphoglycerate mutase [Patescibacteria group bacterium]
MTKKIILVILDGFGLAPPTKGNPITSRTAPFINGLITSYPSLSLVASGLSVGMPWGTFGNSEVGHSAMGTGRIVVQELARINQEIRTGNFPKNPAFVKVLEHAKKNKSRVHLIGCVSPGGIHSHENHLLGLLELFGGHRGINVFVHMITDGEDSSPREAPESLKRLKKPLAKAGAKISTIGGRVYAMDRIGNWELVKKAWDVMVEGSGKTIEDPEKYLKESYGEGLIDSEITPAVVSGAKDGTIRDNDGIVFFNFRNDRMRQIVSSFTDSKFNYFEQKNKPKNLCVATMTRYSDDFPVFVAYEPNIVPNALGGVLSGLGLKQLRVAEQEKEAHVTNFFNGGKISPYAGEERVIVSSRPLVGKGYVEHPEMSADKITEAVVGSVEKDYSLVVANFANTDMIGHTGDLEATRKAVGIIDECVKRICRSCDESGCLAIVTSDHGNAEELIDPLTGGKDTQHSVSGVPIVFVSRGLAMKSKIRGIERLAEEEPRGSLVDVAPSILYFLGINKPEEMTGSLLL